MRSGGATPAPDPFWTLIDGLRDDAGGDLRRLRTLLAGWVRRMDAAEAALIAAGWAAAYGWADHTPLYQAVVVGYGFCGDDTWGDVRAWLICQGRRGYAELLAEPDRLPEFLGADGLEAVDESVGDVLWEFRSSSAAARTAAGPPRGGTVVDLSDEAAVRAAYPRCYAVRQAYLASPLPIMTLHVAPPSAAATERAEDVRSRWSSWRSRRG